MQRITYILMLAVIIILINGCATWNKVTHKPTEIPPPQTELTSTTPTATTKTEKSASTTGTTEESGAEASASSPDKDAGTGKPGEEEATPSPTPKTSSESASALPPKPDEEEISKDIASSEKELADKVAERQKRIDELQKMFENVRESEPAVPGEEVSPVPIAGVKKEKLPKQGDMTELEINLEDVPALDAIKNIADLLEIDYILSPEVGAGGNVTIRTFGKLHLEDLYYVLMAIMEMNGLVAVDVGPYYKIVPTADSLHRPIETIYGKKTDGKYSDDSVLTQIIPLQYITPDEIINTLRPLIADSASIITHPGSNLLVITGLQSNIKRLLKIIELLDVETAVLELEIFQIQYADVNDIISVLERIFQSQRGTPQVGATRTTQTRQQPGQRTRQPAQATQTQSSSGKEIVFIPETRSNSIIVFAQKKDIEFIREIIGMLDVDIYVSRKTYIYPIQNAKASDMANLLSSIYSEKTGQAGAQQTQRTQPRTTRTTQTQQRQPGQTTGTDSIEGEVHIVADEQTNALIIVTSPSNYPYIIETISKLDIMPKQVLIEVLIADVSLVDDFKFGIDWTLRSQGKLDMGGDTYYFDGTSGQDVGVKGDTSSFYYSLFEATRFSAWLKAHSNDSRLEVLSNPHIMVKNNQEAKIDIGSQVPIVTSETAYDTNVTDVTNVSQSYNRTIQYRDTGILLSVTPSINEDRYVSMDISQEVSEVAAWTTEGGVDSPVISTRRASTSVVVKDKQTLVIGGMIQKKNSPSSSGIPFLSKIPVLGWLFGYQHRSHENKELLIFLTPHVITSPDEARDISDQLKDKIQISEKFYKDLEYSWK